jgi:hypothetical protein
MLKRCWFFCALVVFSLLTVQKGIGQTHHQLIQFSGVVVDKTDLKAIPFTAIMIKGSSHGTICDNNGYFSFVAQPTDTVEFVAVGFKTNSYRIPDTLTDRYALIHLMDEDTTTLKPVVVHSWPSKKDFKEAFMNYKPNNDDLDRAKKNLAQAQALAKMQGVPMDAEANYLNTMQSEYNKLYYAGQYPTISLLNPLAWAQFIQAWKNGQLGIQ